MEKKNIQIVDFNYLSKNNRIKENKKNKEKTKSNYISKKRKKSIDIKNQSIYKENLSKKVFQIVNLENNKLTKRDKSPFLATDKFNFRTSFSYINDENEKENNKKFIEEKNRIKKGGICRMYIENSIINLKEINNEEKNSTPKFNNNEKINLY